jgi:hypothetical protein
LLVVYQQGCWCFCFVFGLSIVLEVLYFKPRGEGGGGIDKTGVGGEVFGAGEQVLRSRGFAIIL